MVDEVNAQIIGLDSLPIIDTISLQLSFMVPGAQYTFPFRSGRWDGRERLLTKQLKFPSGLVSRVQEILRSCGLESEVEDRISYPPAPLEVPLLKPLLYPFQEEVIINALAKKRGTVRIATGGGKSVLIAYMCAMLNIQTMVYVVSLDLLSQLHRTIERTLGVPIGIVGGGKCEIRQITVCSVWTAGLACGEKIELADENEDLARDLWEPESQQREKIKVAVRSARMVILDESQFAAAASIRMILKNSVAAAYKYGFSATPWRSGGDDILLEAAFGPKLCDISATDLIQKGYLVGPKIIFRDIPRIQKVKKNWPAVKSAYIVHNETRNQILVNNIKKLVEMGRRPLALFREIKHGKILYDMLSETLSVKMVTGQLSMEERNTIKQDFEDGKVQVLLSSVVYDQGVDLPALDALVLCGGGKSTAKALQRIGRVIRSFTSGEKKDAIVVDTFDQTHFMKDHSLIRYDIYKSEPGFTVKVEPAMQASLGRRAAE